MSAKQKHFYLIAILSFGLISCNSDATPAPTEPIIEDIKVEIANLDGTYQRIRDTQRLNVTSSIPIEIGTEQLAHTQIQIETRCLSSFQNDELLHSVKFHGQSQIDVLDILPAQALSPSQQENPTLRCHIDMEISLNEKLIAQVSLENISIVDAQVYSNENWDFLKDEGQKYFHRSDLKTQVLTVLMADGEANLLCENKSQKILFNQSTVPFEQLLNDSIFDNSSLSLCRLIVRDLNGHGTRLSRSFYLQNQIPQVEQHFQLNLKAQNHLHIKNQAIASLFVKNTSKAVTYIRYTGNQSSLSLSPYYFYLYKSRFIKGSVLNLPAHWQVTDLSKFDRVYSSKNVDILKLDPGNTLVFELIGQNDVSCFQPEKIVVGMGTQYPSLCGFGQILAGFLLNISNGPQLEINSFSDLKSPDWITLPVQGLDTKANLDSENTWSPNVTTKDLCKHTTVIGKFSEMTYIHPEAAPNYLNCKAL